MLTQAGVDSPRLSAEVLMAHCLGIESNELRKTLILSPDAKVSDAQTTLFSSLCDQRAQGIPVAYLTGIKEFYGLDFQVTPATLIPRPDTELLVELGISVASQLAPQDHHDHQRFCPPLFADLGTGSGCIAICMALQLVHWQGVALDISPQALAVARANATRHKVSTLTFIQGSFHTPPLAAQSVRLIVSNPPYISSAHYQTLSPEVKNFEPQTALVPRTSNSPATVQNGAEETLEADGALPASYTADNMPASGLEDCFSIISNAEWLLTPGGVLLMEIGYDQGDLVLAYCQHRGWQDIFLHQDLAGHDRVIQACWMGPGS